jgi:dienelactone hydrolase
MRGIFITFIIFIFLSHSFCQIKTRNIEYDHEGIQLEGYLAYDGLLKSKRGGVLIIHEWWGLNDFIKERANQLAELGYIVFALDMYGKGILLNTYQEASEMSGKFYSDRQLMRERAAAGLQILKQQNNVDTTRLIVMGYCFGGAVALELARSGANLVGAVSFHGGLNTPNPEDAKNIKGSILVLHGADDPNVPAEEVAAFQDEMRQANVDWQMVFYGNAVHSFTNPKSGFDTSSGVAYNYNADTRSWEVVKSFLRELLR